MKYNYKKLFCIIAICAYIFGAVIPTGAVNGLIGSIDRLIAEQNQNSDDESEDITNNDAVIDVKNFTDISSSDWYYKYVELLVNNKVITGTSAGEFSPKGTLSISQSCAVICRYLGLEEDAKQARKVLIDSQKIGSELWYSGYVQILYDCGVLNMDFFSSIGKDGLVDIEKSVFDRPIKRYEFAGLISRSFELNGKTHAKNSYYELCGLGNEFIAGGIYDSGSVSAFKDAIKDFDSIPESYQEDVLKAYYNGIFCGDTDGNFYALNNLSRAEMSKVIAVIHDYSLRQRATVSGVDDSFSLDNYKMVGDSFEGTRLDKQSAIEILISELGGLNLQNSVLSYDCQFEIPSGYACELYIYENYNNTLKISSSFTLSNRNCNNPHFETDISTSGVATLILRNVSKNGRIEAYIDVPFSAENLEDATYGISYPAL